MSGVLVVANETCPCPALHAEVERRARDGETAVLVVAPALNSRLMHYVSDVDAAVAAARERLDGAVSELAGRGLRVEGRVGDADPLQAIADALVEFEADEIIISTHPPGRSNWLERGLVERATERFDQPISHLVSEYALQPAAASE